MTRFISILTFQIQHAMKLWKEKKKRKYTNHIVIANYFVYTVVITIEISPGIDLVHLLSVLDGYSIGLSTEIRKEL